MSVLRVPCAAAAQVLLPGHGVSIAPGTGSVFTPLEGGQEHSPPPPSGSDESCSSAGGRKELPLLNAAQFLKKDHFPASRKVAPQGVGEAAGPAVVLEGSFFTRGNIQE